MSISAETLENIIENYLVNISDVHILNSFRLLIHVMKKLTIENTEIKEELRRIKEYLPFSYNSSLCSKCHRISCICEIECETYDDKFEQLNCNDKQYEYKTNVCDFNNPDTLNSKLSSDDINEFDIYSCINPGVQCLFCYHDPCSCNPNISENTCNFCDYNPCICISCIECLNSPCCCNKNV